MGVVTGGTGRLIDRRVGGALMLGMALLVVLVVPKVLNPPRVDGVASMAPPPPPPAVGDCIDQSISGYSTSDDGQLQMFPPVAVVPCSEPHGSEIVRVDDMPAPVDPAGDDSAVDTLMTNCWLDSQAVWADHDGDWTPQLNITIGIIGPDTRQKAAGQSWTACGSGLSNGRLTGTLDELAEGGAVPPVLGLCSSQDHDQELSYTLITCTDPHVHEELGYREIPAGSPLTQDDVARSCTEMAVRATGRVDLPADEGLVIETEAWSWYESGEGGIVTLPLPADAAGGYASCALHTTDGRMLTSSLRQFGDGPLPFSN